MDNKSINKYLDKYGLLAQFGFFTTNPKSNFISAQPFFFCFQLSNGRKSLKNDPNWTYEVFLEIYNFVDVTKTSHIFNFNHF